MIYGYIRVSSDKQTVENQRFEIEQYCRAQQLNKSLFQTRIRCFVKAYTEK